MEDTDENVEPIVKFDTFPVTGEYPCFRSNGSKWVSRGVANYTSFVFDRTRSFEIASILLWFIAAPQPSLGARNVISGTSSRSKKPQSVPFSDPRGLGGIVSEFSVGLDTRLDVTEVDGSKNGPAWTTKEREGSLRLMERQGYEDFAQGSQDVNTAGNKRDIMQEVIIKWYLVVQMDHEVQYSLGEKAQLKEILEPIPSVASTIALAKRSHMNWNKVWILAQSVRSSLAWALNHDEKFEYLASLIPKCLEHKFSPNYDSAKFCRAWTLRSNHDGRGLARSAIPNQIPRNHCSKSCVWSLRLARPPSTSQTMPKSWPKKTLGHNYCYSPTSTWVRNAFGGE